MAFGILGVSRFSFVYWACAEKLQSLRIWRCLRGLTNLSNTSVALWKDAAVNLGCMVALRCFGFHPQILQDIVGHSPVFRWITPRCAFFAKVSVSFIHPSHRLLKCWMLRWLFSDKRLSSVIFELRKFCVKLAALALSLLNTSQNFNFGVALNLGLPSSISCYNASIEIFTVV